MNGIIGGYGIHTLNGNCGKYGGRIGYVDGIGYDRMIKYGDDPAYGSGSMNIDRGGHLNGAVFDGCGAFSIGAAYDARGSFINGAAYDRGGYFGVRRDRSLFEREKGCLVCVRTKSWTQKTSNCLSSN